MFHTEATQGGLPRFLLFCALVKNPSQQMFLVRLLYPDAVYVI